MTDARSETRVCETCKAEKPWTIEFWPIDKGNPRGPRCRTCVREYNRMFRKRAVKERVAARTAQQVSLNEASEPPASGTEVSKSKDALPGELPLRQLAVAKALRAGAAIINERAGVILEKLFGYAGNAESPHHEWALKLIADRLLPRKLYEDLGAKDAGIMAGEGSSRPSVVIIVQPATVPAPADAPSGATVEGEV